MDAATAAAVVSAALVLAALTIRSAVAELRRPGSAREQWRFLRDPGALTAAGVTAVLLGVVGWRQAAGPGLVWALLAAVLVGLALGARR
ncbi:hypothetical protein [Streptomyces sp. NPDC089799]|uniref:hypothetical protein n=1 Tax=Streptomyces sp. NPDC089799 TaxID=3155066 RepID=UPI003439AB7F